MNNTVLFITAFKDINRGSWSIFTRSIQDYLAWFTNTYKINLLLR